MNRRITAPTLVLLLCAMHGQAQDICMEALTFGVANGQPRGIVAAHLNGDAFLDVATSNFFTQDISICFGNGDATFQPAQNLALGSAPTDIITADFNNDGLADLATSTPGALGVHVLLNLGGGSFASPVLYAVPCCNIWTLMAVDIDGDTTLDLLVPSSTGFGTLTVLHGIGDGTFTQTGAFNTGIAPVSLDVADLNADGNLDVVYSHLPGLGEVDHYFCVLWGTGPGTFGAVQQVFCPFTNLDAMAADVNGDGHADVLTANSSDGSVSKFLGHGDGTIDPAITFAASIGPSSLQLSDMNMDGYPDLLLSDYSGNAVDVMPGNGTGVYGTLVHTVCAVDPVGFAVGHFNADAYPDVVVGSAYDNLAYFGIVVNCLSTGVSQSVAEEAIRLSPVPADGELNIAVPSTLTAYRIQIVDAIGRELVVQQGTTTTTAVSTQYLPSGAYFARVTTRDGAHSASLPFVVLHP
jgi:hypothetical protein